MPGEASEEKGYEMTSGHLTYVVGHSRPLLMNQVLLFHSGGLQGLDS